MPTDGPMGHRAQGPRSNMSESKLEWLTLPLNSRTQVRRGLIFALISVSAELTRRMLGQGRPETCRVGTSGHVVPVNIVRIGDPRKSAPCCRKGAGYRPALMRWIKVPALRSEGAEVNQDTRRVRIGCRSQDPRLCMDWLPCSTVASLQEEAVTNVVVDHVVFDVLSQ